jgi:hypothetical protein
MAIKRGEREQFNQQLKAAAFTAWRLELTLSGLFGGQAQMTYTDYCEQMGLLTEEEKRRNEAIKKLQQLHNKQIAKEAEQRANDIMALDKAARARERGAKEKGG